MSQDRDDDLLLKKNQVAGNGLLDRRLFLKKGLQFSAISTLVSTATLASATAETKKEFDPANPTWMKQPGKAFSPYGLPSEFEDDVLRYPSPNEVVTGNGVSWTPLHKMEGTITPNGLHYERHHNGVPQIDPKQHRLLIHGLVKNDLIFSIDDLLRYPMQSKTCFIECGGNSNAGWNSQPHQAEAGYFNGMVSCCEWTGVPLSVLLNEVGLRKNAKWIIAEGADAFAMQMSIPIEKAMDDAFLALYQNGERIRPENGYPLRLIVPGWEGVLNVKWLRRLKVTNRPVMARNETSKYTELQPSGKSRMFTFPMEAKSLITSPSAHMLLKEKGLYQITGLAWSGRGKISKVDVSADGGKTWAEAELQQPVLDRSLTRFRLPWQWNGKQSVIMSRATDETGYVQPDRNKLIKERGKHGFFHYNAITRWQIDTDGFVSHIYENDETTKNNSDISIDSGWD
ncbi:MAG: sulfite dehydrogenase [Proteobacteria bacterium]|nr:sulfite dehydrogenase [Pseudomonadota bacterium]NOG59725.1 sulfite dehydrogenase [Pseudomonadota bacterium]